MDEKVEANPHMFSLRNTNEYHQHSLSWIIASG